MEELWVEVDGARVFVCGWGERSGRPLFCWHGVGLTSRASMFLNEAGPLLADGYGLRVLALDAPGFGKSPPIERQRWTRKTCASSLPMFLRPRSSAPKGRDTTS
jgi:pimeloyl-ACP methyl ester carboxylesterase